MKKIFSLVMFSMLAFSVLACDTTTTTTGGTTVTTAPIVFATEEYPFLLNVQFVPSTSVNAEMTTKLVRLESLLEEELYSRGYVVNVNISVGTSYATVIEAMASGQVHIGFLTAQQYAFTTLEYPGDVEVLLTSVRDAYKAQLDSSNVLITNPATIIANANAAGYDGTTTKDVKVSSYYSMLLVRDEDYAAYQAEGISWLAGKNVGTQSTTSGSGFSYPSLLLSENDLKFVPNGEGPDEAAGEVGYTTISGHQAAVIALLNEEVDAVFTFFDARYNTTGAYDTWQAAHVGVNIFEVTRVAALTTGIYNDTISGVSSLSDGLKAAIQQSFIDVIANPEGLAALAIYNHKGYLIANDDDYDGERDLWEFLHPAD